MPNWCNNSISITHPDQSKIEALAEAVRNGKFCNFICPVPEDLMITAGRLGDGEEQRQLELKEAANLKNHGYANWYDYCVNEWGTKWDVDCYEGEELKADGNLLQFGFDSAWAPPTALYEKMLDQGYTIRAFYYESGMGFCGVFDENGDDYYDITNMNSTEVADTIPSELDECMNISESIAEWEDENEEDEELTEWYKDGVDKNNLEPHK